MRNHEPSAYDCPMCRLVAGKDTPMTPAEAVVYRDDHTTALVCGKWWSASPGHLLVVPTTHVENLYDLPDDLAAPLLRTVRRMAVLLSTADGCDGTSIRQHNEPAGDQDVWHLHIHVFPRWHNDDLYGRSDDIHLPTKEEQIARAEVLRKAL
ncbi:HIT family protein [Umezawaea sp. NPDC059074]|uniref:HIT family protein n=1 Tax=Umezawaea sp. NPDC059074 TaxID=3346716 RepID=UPI0036BFC661